MITERQEISAIVSELHEAGYNVSHPGHLRESGSDYTSALPILVSWLPRVRDPNLHESLLRTIAIKPARPYLEQIIDDFERIDDPPGPGGYHLRWAAGNTINVLWHDRAFDRLRKLLTDRSYGPGRQMVVSGLGKSKHPDAGRLAISLLDDDDVRGHAVVALKKLKPAEAREPLERVRPGQTRWVQREIDKTLAKLPAAAGATEVNR